MNLFELQRALREGYEGVNATACLSLWNDTEGNSVNPLLECEKGQACLTYDYHPTRDHYRDMNCLEASQALCRAYESATMSKVSCSEYEITTTKSN